MDQAPMTKPSRNMLDELARLGETRMWEPGAIVVNEGDPAHAMYLVHEGELRAFVGGDGGRLVELNTLGPGEFFGELMFSGEERAASVQVIRRARLTCVAREKAERLLALEPDLALQLVQSLVQRVRTLTHTVGRLSSTDVYGRLVGLFDALAVVNGDRRTVPGPLSQQRIAERVGASRAMINRLLQDLTRGGYIEVTRDGIEILKNLPARW